MGRRAPSYDALAHEYASLWETMEIRAERMPAISATARRIIGARARYQQIETATGVPWYVVGIIHAMESGCNWTRHLHNGDPLTARTVQVPAGRPLKGRGPFSWEESACDALTMKRLERVADWSVPRIAYELERYNGFGYRQFHPETLSPYLWSGTGHYTRGKYVADGKWSPTAVSGQSGAMALLKRIAELDPSVVLDAPSWDASVEFSRTPETADDAPKTMAQSTTGNTAILMGGGGGAPIVGTAASNAAAQANSFQEFAVILLASPMFWSGLVVVIGAAYVWIERRKKLVEHGV